MIKLLAVLAAAAAFGGMVFFAAVVAPLVFAKLPTATAAAFIRQLFPVYYVVMAGFTAVAALLTTGISAADALLLTAISAGFLYARVGLLPRLDQARERAGHGDTQAAARFRRLHRAGTVLNALQLVAVASALVRLAS